MATNFAQSILEICPTRREANRHFICAHGILRLAKRFVDTAKKTPKLGIGRPAELYPLRISAGSLNVFAREAIPSHQVIPDYRVWVDCLHLCQVWEGTI